MAFTTDKKELLTNASKRHGHLCPSLYYGVSTAYQALKQCEGAADKPVKIILNGTSKCMKDGLAAVMEHWGNEQLSLEIKEHAQPLGITLLTADNNKIMVFVNPVAQAEVNRLNASLSTEEFQVQGVAYLQSLALEDFLTLS